jgi:hypothetical protein
MALGPRGSAPTVRMGHESRYAPTVPFTGQGRDGGLPPPSSEVFTQILP